MTSVKTVHHLISEAYWRLVWWDGLAKKKFQSFRLYQASPDPSRPEAIYIICFRVTAWLNYFSSVRHMYSCLWKQQQKKKPLINRSTKMQCLNLRLDFSGALQPMYPVRKSKSNYDFCENCSSLDKWSLLKIGLVRWSCQKEVSEFQAISSQSDPSRPEAIYIICFRVTAWLNYFSSVRHMYSCLWKQQQKKKPLINRSTKMQCLNLRLDFSGALQPMYPVRKSKSNYDFCENCSSLDKWSLLKIGLVRWSCQKEVSEFQAISSQSDPSRPEAIYIICFRVTAWLNYFSSVRHMYSCLWKQQQKKKPLINRSTKMQCLNLRLDFSGALQPMYPVRKSKSNYDFCENCSSLDKWSLLKIGLVRWSCQKEVSEFQAISSQSDPSRPEAIYIICFRVTAWLNYFSSVRHMYSCLWKQQQKKKPLINRSTKMQCLNLRLDFSGALQPMYPVRKSKSNYDFCENCSSLDKWSLLKIGLVRWSCQKEVSEFQAISSQSDPSRPEAIYIICFRVTAWLNYFSSVRHMYSCLWKQQQKKKPLINRSTKMQCLNLRLDFSGALQPMYPVRKSKSNYDFCENCSSLDKWSLLKIGLVRWSCQKEVSEFQAISSQSDPSRPEAIYIICFRVTAWLNYFSSVRHMYSCLWKQQQKKKPLINRSTKMQCLNLRLDFSGALQPMYPVRKSKSNYDFCENCSSLDKWSLLKIGLVRWSCQKEVSEFQAISSQSDPSRPEAIYIICFRVTAWLNYFSSVRHMYSCLWKQQQKKKPLINRSTKMQCLNLRLDFSGALQPMYPVRKSKSNYDFCENCSSLDKWSLLKIGLVRWSCQKEVSEFQAISSQSDPSRPEAIYIICFRVTAWLNYFSSVRHMYSCLWKQQQKKKPLINRSTKMQCLNLRLDFSGALQPMYPVRKSKSNYDFCENCSSLDKWSLLKIGLVRWSCQKEVSEFQAISSQSDPSRPEAIYIICFRVTAWLNYFSSVRHMYSCLWKQQQKKKPLINRSTKMQCLNLRLDFSGALQPMYPVRKSKSNYDFCENCSSLDKWSLLKIGLVRWSCQKEVSEFQAISSQSDPSRPEAIYIICFRVTAWLNYFSSVRHMYSCLWKQQQKKKPLINRSTKMQCLNLRLDFSGALQPMYPVRKSKSNYDFCENCSSLDKWSLLKIGLVRWSCQKEVSEFQAISSQSDPSRPEAIYIICFRVTAWLNYFSSVRHMYSCLWKQQQKKKPLINRSTKMQCLNLRLDFSGALQPMYPVRKSKSNYDFCENCSSLDKWSLLKIGLVRWSCQKEVSEFQAISSQSDPSRPEAIYIICFRVTAWLNYFSSVRHMYSCLWKQQQKKKPLINRSTKMQCLNLRLDFSGALQPMYPVRKSKSNYDFCENCSPLDKWSLLKIGLVRWSCQKEVSEFQAISSQSDPSRPEAIYIICFRVTAWLNYFSSVRHMYSCLWKQQQKKKPLINRSTKMQCLNLRLDFSGALQPMYPVRKSKSNYDFCENCSSLDKWSLLKIGLVRWSCQKEVSEFQAISSQSDPSRPEAIYIICFRVTAWLNYFSSVRHMYSCLWKQQQKKKPLINRSTKMQCLNLRLDFSGALQPMYPVRKSKSNYDFCENCSSLDKWSLLKIGLVRWSCQKEVSEFQAISSQSDPSRPEAIYIICFRVTAWLNYFSSVRHMYSCLWKQQQKKKPLINRSTKMQCLNRRRLGVSRALQPPSDSSIFLRGTIMPQNSGNFYERSNQYWRPISWLQWR